MDHLFSFWICCGGGGGDGWSSLFRVQVDGDDQTVQTQDFSENEDQNHTDEQSGLLGSTTDTGITDDTDGETGGQTGESYSQTSTEMDEAPGEREKKGDFC